MRIRGTKPEFWRSRRIAAVDWEDRFILKGLESYVDDNGVGKDDIELIVGDLFQRDLVREPSRTLARLSEGLSRLHSAGLVWRYEHEGTALLYISFWESAQRVDKPNPGRFRRPDGTKDYKESVIEASDANPREDSRSFAPGTEEQRNRGTEEGGYVSRETHQATATVLPPQRVCSQQPHPPDKPCWECRDIRESDKRESRELQSAKTNRLSDFWAEVRRCTDCDPNGHVEGDDDGGDELVKCPAHDWGLISA